MKHLVPSLILGMASLTAVPAFAEPLDTSLQSLQTATFKYECEATQSIYRRDPEGSVELKYNAPGFILESRKGAKGNDPAKQLYPQDWGLPVGTSTLDRISDLDAPVRADFVLDVPPQEGVNVISASNVLYLRDHEDITSSSSLSLSEKEFKRSTMHKSHGEMYTARTFEVKCKKLH